MQCGKMAPSELNVLFAYLRGKGYQVIGPTVENNCITYNQLNNLEDLPKGYTDFQEKGVYRLKKRQDDAYFGYNIGSRSFKNFLFPPREKIFSFDIEQEIQFLDSKKLAFIGVRSCELHAIHIQDKVFMTEPFVDIYYQNRRQLAFIVSLNCHTAVNTCFCASMNTGPEVTLSFDLNLSEIINEQEHYFICEVGSQRGLEAFLQLNTDTVTEKDFAKKQKMIQTTSQNMGRKLDTTLIKEKLEKKHDHPHWQDVASRCINCGNCTSACPTCFCSRTEHHSDLDLTQASGTKIWDSCFSQEFSYIHDAYVRPSSASRYRQWLTHKLGTWHDQFNSSGCVGCGRCITWCPVGIDITAEYAALTQSEEPHEDHS